MTVVELRIGPRQGGKYNVDLLVDGKIAKAYHNEPSMYEALLRAGEWIRELTERERVKT